MSALQEPAARAIEEVIHDDVDLLEQAMLRMEGEQLEPPEPVHLFATNCYVRQLTMPTGAVLVGHRHLTDHVNNIVSGKALVSLDGEVHEMEGPHVFVSEPGVRKALVIVEEMTWQTVHIIDLPTEEVPKTKEERAALVEKLEPLIIDKSEAWLEHHQAKEIESMKNLQTQIKEETP
jgi:quercetin dioxygenase-like cupin family protein